MTDREKAIVMAFTGICMLTGDKFQIFHKYVEDIMGRPIMTHEIGFLEGAIKKKAEADFIALCEDESSSENPNRWIPCSERLPEDMTYVLTTIQINSKRVRVRSGNYYHGFFNNDNGDVWNATDEEVTAWMPLPEPYKAESEE